MNYYRCWSAKVDADSLDHSDGQYVATDISGNPDCKLNEIQVNTDGTLVSFYGLDPVGAAIIKGSNDANIYVYAPQVSDDSGLASPVNSSGGSAALSNIGGFCWNPETANDPSQCYEGETAWAAGTRYTKKGNWATFTPYSGSSKTVSLVAGQTMPAGSVSFAPPTDGVVTVTVTLSGDWRFALAPVDEDEDGNIDRDENGNPIYDDNIKVQDYATAPAGNPAPGLFAYKLAQVTGNTATIDVPANGYYGVHVDVQRPVACP